MPTLEMLWNSLEKKQDTPAFLRVDEIHPLDIYVGKDVMGERILLLLTDDEPQTPGQYRALQIAKQLRNDGRWALTVKLVQPELGRLFAHLCQDLVDSSSTARDERTATEILIAQLERWQRLMARGQVGLLEESEVRGLFAELVYLERFAIPFRGVQLALEGWVGPLEADQDFRLGDRLAEIKSCAPGGTNVSISSADQLDVFDTPLFLVVVILEDGNQGGNYVSLNELVARIRTLLVNDNSAITTFDDRLKAAGYTVRPEYGDKGYVVLRLRHFRVSETFPRIVTSLLAAGIIRVKYDVSLSACSTFEQDSSVVD